MTSRTLYTLLLSALLSFALYACSDSDDGNPSSTQTSSTTPTTTTSPNDAPIGQHSAEYCGQCHTAHYDDWSGSMHAYASKDPIFQAMLQRGLEETDGKLDQFCIQCHAPVASKYDMTPVLRDSQNSPSVNLDMDNHLIADGVQCATCHSIRSVNATLNADFELDSTTYFGPTGSAAAQEAHPMSATGALTQAVMCGSCHNVVNPKGALLENTFSEWYASEFNTGNPETDKTCIDCHMPTRSGPIVSDAPDSTIHRHQFVGVDLALIDDFPHKEEQLRLVTELLQSCVILDVERTEDHDNSIALRVSITNINNGHALPSGSTADRQVWVHLTVRDENNNVVYESGMLDENGDLMDRVDGHSLDPHGDPDLLLYGSLLFGDDGEHVTFPWQAARSQDILLQPGQTGWREYLIPKANLSGQTLTATAVLKYRTFPPFLIRELEESGHLQPGLIPPIPIVEMAQQELDIPVR